ncbi:MULTISPECIES: hypothetical protein [unclassified Crossiella]|uniref:hypothetical protein n=1 Tax=unclassified Crossiella TaxID=2620835 RepID=UPI001FFFB24D|nr:MULTISPECIES: hypothetical protein [unclassified Crossiella]MCK2244541.1 hypothetical protein [Crossiella sp. S99.2]MCK2258172.1 hypothetical protein [Crossiella sp. S99.1]
MTAARKLPPTALDPLTAVLQAVAVRTARQFEERNLTIRRSRVVHGVAPSKWMAGVELPGPACHVGVAGWALEDMHPSTRPVTCRRCLRGSGQRLAPPLRLVDQLALPLDGRD